MRDLLESAANVNEGSSGKGQKAPKFAGLENYLRSSLAALTFRQPAGRLDEMHRSGAQLSDSVFELRHRLQLIISCVVDDVIWIPIFGRGLFDLFRGRIGFVRKSIEIIEDPS